MSEVKNLDVIWKDLATWEKEINAKDETLSKRKPVHDQILPPVRKSTEIVLGDAKPMGIDSISVKKTSPTKTPAPSSPSSISPKTRAEKAEAEKAKGNEYFSKQDYNKAIIFYGKAIDLDPTISVYFVNRAMAYLKINKYLEAEKDCTRGIQLQPKNVKALWRRGIALRELGRISEARRDFEMGLTIEPNNKSLLDELRKLPAPKTTKQPEKISKTVKSDTFVEQKRRLPINVVDEAFSEDKLLPISAQPVKAVKPIEPKLTPTLKKVKAESVNTPKPATSKAAPVIEKVTPKITEITSTEAPTNKKTTTTAEIKAPIKKPTVTPVNFKCPSTNFEFERDWKTYKNRGEDILYQYFQCIPPASYAALFKSSLESDQFEKMLEILESRYVKEKTPQDIYAVLEGLSQVKRIDMLIMFLNKKHQQAIQELFDLLKTADVVPIEKLTKAAKTYDARV